ncbi:2'-5' RNA ligase [Treponema ruminis]|uniref:RNA ligase (TIGR02306 family) n=1 Tax=Treponema ruminis TaxID=744515 RepID=A0A7W8GAG6_9SPIR|nr:RNA ligase family protein [Treponema ruminis]MBB5226853.1 RNA ligase (TIGR02306 family) [Treponema ruminis]QSI01283.1 2'-5' RNA ligase [Treponema ruminis]
MRKLASVQTIWDVQSIEGADRIEVVSVLGWKCVTKKGVFKKYDLCVYFEVDAFLPVKPEFEFLRDGCYRCNELNGEGFLMKTRNFRGQVSQGLVLPLSILDGIEPLDGHAWKTGDIVSEQLGVKKWEVAEIATGSGRVIGDFPHGIPKTDEIRVQAEPGLIDEFKGVPYYISTKMDGTSVTMYLIDGDFGVCSRNYEIADDETSPAWKFVHKHNVIEKIKKGAEAIGLKNVAVQGEFCGEGIQKNPLKLVTAEWYVFTLRDMDQGKRLGLKTMQAFCDVAGLNMVPVEETGDNLPYKTVDEFIERAKGKYASGNHKEGIVIRPIEPVYSKILEGPLSMKVINNDYLLKQK